MTKRKNKKFNVATWYRAFKKWLTALFEAPPWLNRHPRLKKFLKVVMYIGLSIAVFLFLLWFAFGRTVLNQPEDIVWGTTYSAKAAEELNLDPVETYRSVVEDLKPNKLRLVAYWDRIESSRDVYDYSELDFQVRLAEANNIPYVIAVGRRVPRYPECHAPQWSESLSQGGQNEEVLEIIQTTIERYGSNLMLRGWQIENEPFVGSFGVCPKLDEKFYAEEVELARSLTDKTIYATESGELSVWLKISPYPDVVGTTLYRVVLANSTTIAVQHIFPSWYYRARSNIIKYLRPQLQEVIVAELQAEPWGTKPLIEEEDAFLAKTMNPRQFERNIRFSENVGFPEVDFWGVEWWYYELQRGNDFYWERAREQFRK